MEIVGFSDGTVEVEVLPSVGARLHRLRAFGHDLLRTPADPEEHARDPFFWGAYVMAPWCNRIEAGPVVLGTRRIALGPNFPDGSAIHGRVYARPWDVLDDGSFRVTGGGEGWPWDYEAGLAVAVADRTARLELTLTDRSPDPMPAGLGIHPWFRRPIEVAIRGAAVYPLNTATRSLPEPVDGPYDLREAGEMAPDLDATWTDLADPPVELRWPELAIRATMRVRAPTILIVAASPAHLDAVAVEPQTHAPQGLRRLLGGEPAGLAMVAPGETLRLEVELAFERYAVGPGGSK